MAVLPLRIQVRRDQDTLFNAENPLLLEGEIAFSIDKNKVKIGDGINRWQALDYLDDELAAKVDVLTSDATVDGSVDAKVAAEAALRAEVDTAHATRLDTLEGDDSVAGSVDGKIMVEAAARQAADETLQQEIDVIKADVIAKEIDSDSADALLNTKVDNLSATVESNNLASETADGTLQTNINLESARVDALIQSGMWLFTSQAAFPPATENHGRIVHSHADASMFYAHDGVWHKIEREDEAQAARDVLQDNLNQEVLRAGTAEAANAAAITAEETRALAAEAANAAAITAEETRAEAAEGALDTRTTALEDTLNGNGTASDDDGIANKANYAYSAIVTDDGIHDRLDGLETNKANLSGAAFTGAVSVVGTFQLTDVAALSGALTVDGISELKGGLVVTGGGSTTTTFNVGTDLGVGGNAIVTGSGNFGVGLEVKEQVLARSAALNDNPDGPDATPIIPFLAAKSDDVVTKAFLDQEVAAAILAAFMTGAGGGSIPGPFDDGNAALAGGVSGGGIYYTSAGEVKVVV